ncbi:TetR/AcrR family transcriptional regulator [Alteraurantiacibacter aquimixticola]|uniref:TetR/AcrR family transcriptional regulator n=1 Tax=Alteraurantiacibacter aquimixticola TaxID=2489173 RepID=A0A4T3F7I2_9SPHN|nr:TetR/AcrR family transcriptional regulator [Alteraurantiacibacter aquimixticola]TIX50930.1 TetR/AcrR family transcriptional regulator [Alteraurantiacibacter aquimixticola]
MARPRSDEKRSAILSAATCVIAAQGLGAATAAIAKEAGVSNGSLFTYFETKADLLNQLYVELKSEMSSAALDQLPAEGDVRAQAFKVWQQWIRWGATFPQKRRALAHLNVSGEITEESRQVGHQVMLGFAEILERSRKTGPLSEAPLEFVMLLVNALADTTMDFMTSHPTQADEHSKTAFEGVWRMLA